MDPVSETGSMNPIFHEPEGNFFAGLPIAPDGYNKILPLEPRTSLMGMQNFLLHPLNVARHLTGTKLFLLATMTFGHADIDRTH